MALAVTGKIKMGRYAAFKVTRGLLVPASCATSCPLAPEP